jgi:hypothetical protein
MGGATRQEAMEGKYDDEFKGYSNFDWTDDNVIDFVNWYVEVMELGTRYTLENKSLLDSFKIGDVPSDWNETKNR